MQDYTIDELKNLDDDVLLVNDLAEEWEVDLSGLEDVSSMVERLVLHKLKITDKQYFKLEKAGFEAMKIEQEKKTLATIDLFKNLHSILKPCMGSVNSILKAGGMTDHLEKDLEQHITDLERRECCVVFSGETSAGKSSILNLLLGEDVLPTHIMSCTFVICKLKYGKHYGSRVIYADGNTENNSFDSAQDTKKHLDHVVFKRGVHEREAISDVTEIHIYLPAEILKSGITIVDTPGFGENSDLNQMVIHFLATHKISAFVYVVKSDNAGGVQDDRLLDFLRNVRQQKKRLSCSIREDNTTLAAMFICNRWDVIQEDQQDKVRQNALSKLADAWPDFKPSQTVFFSTEAASKHFNIDQDYISEDFAQLLEKMVNLSQTALDNTIKQHYGWLKRVLHHATNHVTSIVKQLNKSDEDLCVKFTDAKVKLQTLENNSDSTLSGLKELIHAETNSLAEKLKCFLQDYSTETAITKWSLHSDLNLRRSSTSSIQNPLNKKVNYDSIALRNLLDEIDSWIKNSGLVEMLSSRMEVPMSNGFGGLHEEIKGIMREMTDTSSLSSSSTSSSSCIPDDDIEHLLDQFNKRKQKSKFERIAESGQSTNAFKPKVVVVRALLTAIQTVQAKRRMSAMDADPNGYVIERGLKFRDTLLLNQSLLVTICERYTESLVIHVNCIEESIPKFIQTNRELMDEIQRNRQLTSKDKEKFSKTLYHLERAKHVFSGFGLHYIRDIRPSSISIDMDTEPVLSKSTQAILDSSLDDSKNVSFTFNICFFTQLGTALIDNQDEDVISRTSTANVPEETLFDEIVKLKSIHHDNLAAFLGVVRMRGKSVLLFSGNLTSLRRYIRNPCTTDLGNKTEKVISGLLYGLKCLHADALVHMELSTKTVMVDSETGVVKLIGGCLPRAITLAQDSTTMEVGDLVYLSPDVLRGKIYTSADDIYSLGLIIWELMNQKNPLSDYRSWTQSKFINEVDPTKIIPELPNGLRDIVSGCIHTSAVERSTIHDLQLSLTNIDWTPLLRKLKVQRREGFRKSSRNSLR